MLADAKQLEGLGQHVIHMEIGQPSFGSPEHVVSAAVEALRNGETKYVSPAGTLALREAIAEYTSSEKQVKISAAQVVVGPGAKPGLLLSALSVLNQGDEVIYPDPGFPAYKAICQIAGANERPVPLRPDGSSFDMPTLRGTINKKTKLMIINSPSNPTGGVMSREDLEEIAGLALEYNCWVLSDEIYSFLTYTDGPTFSLLNIPEMRERTIVVDGFSKTFCMTGWRLGWAIMPEELARRVELMLVHSVGCTAAFTQTAGVAALRGPQAYKFEMLAEYRKRRDFVVQFLNQIPGVVCPTPGGAFYAFPDISAYGMSSKDLAQLLLHQGKVAVLPGVDFGACGEGHLRISYVGNMNELEEGLRRMRECLNEVWNRKPTH